MSCDSLDGGSPRITLQTTSRKTYHGRLSNPRARWQTRWTWTRRVATARQSAPQPRRQLSAVGGGPRPGRRRKRTCTGHRPDHVGCRGYLRTKPFADGANALISLGRGDWLGAGLSGISIIPYIGDLAKAGKLPRYSQKLYDAIQLARRNPEFAKLLRPVLEKLKSLVDSIPTDISSELTEFVAKIKRPLDDYLGLARVARRFSLEERLIMARLGSLHNIGDLVWKNVRTAKEYFLRHGVPENEMINAMYGIDLHSTLNVVPLKTGDKLTTYVLLSDGRKLKYMNDKQIARLTSDNWGQWFVKSGDGVGKESTGIAHGAREAYIWRFTGKPLH